MKDLILVGGGGHCKSVIDSIKSKNEFNIVGILDTKEKLGQALNDIKFIGTDEDYLKFFNKGIKYAFITIGSIGNTIVRENVYYNLKKIGFHIPIIIDDSSIVSKGCFIDEGSFIGKGVVINTDVNIGKNCIINTRSIIEHDSVIEDFVHIAPGSVLSGNVFIGEKTHIGTNSTVIQNIRVSNNCLIGAGSVVISDISCGKKAYGNPCKER